MASQENPHAPHTKIPHVWEQLNVSKEMVLGIAKNRAVNTDIMGSDAQRLLKFKDKDFLLNNSPDSLEKHHMNSMIVSVYGKDRIIKCGSCRITGGIHEGCVCFPGGDGISAVDNGACANCIYRGSGAKCEYNSTTGVDAQPISKRHVHGSDKGWRRRCLFVKEINEYFRLSKQEKRYDDPAPLHGVEARELGLEVRLTPAQLEAARLEAARQEPVQLEYQHYGRPRAPFPGGPNLHDDPDQVSWGNNTYRPTGVRGVIANKDLRGSDLKLAIMETLLRQEHGQRYGQHHQRSRDYRSPHGGRRDYTNKGQVPQSYSNRDLDKVGYDERDRLYKLDNYGLGNDYDDGVDYSEGAYLIQDGSTHLPQANSGSLPTRTVSQASSATSHCTVPPNYELGKARTVSQASSSTTLKHTVPTNYEFAKARTLPRAETVPRAPSLTTSQHTIPTNYEFGKVRTFPPSVTSQQDSHRPTILHTLNPPPINAPPKRQVAAGNSIQNLNNPSSTTSSVPANQITSGNGSRYVTIGERAMQMFTHDSDASSIMSRTSSPEFLPLQAQKIPAKVVFQREPSAPIQIDIQPQLDDSSASVSVQAVNPRSKWRALREVELMSYEEAEAPRATRSQKLKH